MKPTARDVAFMRRALAEAEKGLGRTSPNPAVGAVIVKRGEVLATGWHRKAGTDHAEVAALRKLGFRARGAELYTTLEPCDHQGRTGPCSAAILEAGIKRVVVGAADPNPKVKGRGLRRLSRAGVEVVRGVLEEECTRLNAAFNFAIVAGRPYVVLKAATSLDGRVATRTGESKWITGEAARKEGRKLRDRLDAILVGVGTVLADDPALTTRRPRGRDPVRVVLDSALRTPPTAQVAREGTVVITTEGAPEERRRALEDRGVEVIAFPADPDGRVPLDRALAAIHEKALNGVLVEGGARVHEAFLRAGLVNEIVLYLAPMWIGGAGHLADAVRLGALHVRGVGADLEVSGRVL